MIRNHNKRSLLSATSSFSFVGETRSATLSIFPVMLYILLTQHARTQPNGIYIKLRVRIVVRVRRDSRERDIRATFVFVCVLVFVCVTPGPTPSQQFTSHQSAGQSAFVQRNPRQLHADMEMAKSFFGTRDHDGYVGKEEHAVSRPISVTTSTNQNYRFSPHTPHTIYHRKHSKQLATKTTQAALLPAPLT